MSLLSRRRQLPLNKNLKEKVKASIQNSKADAEARQESFKTGVKARKTTVAAQSAELQDNYNGKVQEMLEAIDVRAYAESIA